MMLTSGKARKDREPGSPKGAARPFLPLALACLAAALTLPAASPATAGVPMSGSDLSLRRNVIDGGGGSASAAGYSLSFALAEAATEASSAGAFKLNPGFGELATQPGSVISLTAVSKSTGNLELAWLAPGLNGFLGGVVGGYYRIDASSLTSHAFDPTVFITEFSTSVAPGDQQRYTLSGLQPNTTYFARIYLADSRKVVAEHGSPAEASSLANLPAAPTLGGVYHSSVTFTWALPEGGAAGYKLDGSSTNYGAELPGGVVISSGTGQGTLLTLTVTGLFPDTTYFFRLASLNWQSDMNFTTIIATRTLPGAPPLPIGSLVSQLDALARRINFSWNTPAYDEPAGVLVQVSTRPITAGLETGQEYPDGSVFPDGSVVLSSAAENSQLHAGLTLNSTYYYRFTSQNTARAYSISISTECILDLPPMSPAGLAADLSPDRSEITLSWAGVASNLDGSLFRGGEPMEISNYAVYRATGLVRPSWTLVASVPAPSETVTVPVPDTAKVYYYRVSARDSVGEPGNSMVADTARNLYALAADGISRLKIPADLAGVVRPSGNPSGRPIFFAASDRPSDEGGKVMKSVEFKPLQAPDGKELANFRFEKPDMDIVLRYDTENGSVVPSSFRGTAKGAEARLLSSVRASAAASELGIYWHNGREYVKVFGDVDTLNQTITVRSALPGSYQIRSLARAQGASFGIKEMSNKVITPNGDGLNDYVVFTLDNPGDVSFGGKVYDLTGALVAEMRPGTQIADTLQWDGRAGGAAVPRGVYVYQIKAGDKTFSGTLVVIR